MAVTRRLAALEQELGVRLLQRTTRSVSQTPEGAEFLPYARSMIETQGSARALSSPDVKGATGLLRIAAPSGIDKLKNSLIV